MFEKLFKDDENLKAKVEFTENTLGDFDKVYAILPSKYKDIEYLYNDVVKKKYNVNHLEVPNRLEGINKEIVLAFICDLLRF